MSPLPRIAAPTAAGLFLEAQGLLDPPEQGSGPEDLLGLVTRLGFVQVDTIQTVARAHDLILHARRDSVRPGDLATLVEGRACFEGFTHDASVIPTLWYEQWRPRWRRDRPRIEAHPWWQNLLGPEQEGVCAHVLARIRAEGPLGSADFAHPEKRGPWWGWKPQKAALDYLWRTGQLAISGRVAFHKRYDLPERVFPEAHARPEPSPEAHVEWACATAAERLVLFTPRELAAFWAVLDPAEVRAWCEKATRLGRIQPVEVASADGSTPQRAYAVANWEARASTLPETDHLRLLAPFDPVLRDRARALRRFGFDHRFEAFVPEAKRRFGYYVLPILEGTRVVGRLDPKLHRAEGRLEVKGLWWEQGIKPTRARLARLRGALERLATFTGATRLDGI